MLLPKNTGYFKKLTPSIWLASLALPLASCGGGGGGGGSGNNTPTPPPAITLLAIDSSNATAVVSSESAVYENFVELASLAIASIDLANRSSGALQNIGCDNNGSFSAVLTDRDNNHVISAGDSITFTYTQCDLRMMGGQISGSLSVDISSFSADNSSGNWMLAGAANLNATLTNSSGTGAITGTYDFNYQKNAQGDTTQITGSSVPVAVKADNYSESYPDFNVAKNFDINTAKYSVTGSFSNIVDSEEVQCSTVTALEGLETQMPTAGVMQCTGANNTAVRGGPTAVTNGLYGNWFIDLNSGNGVFSSFTSAIMTNSFDGVLFGSVVLNQPYGAGSGANIVSSVQVVNYGISNTGALYVITSSTAPTLPKRLIEIDPATGSTLRSISLAQEPATLAVTPDGSKVYVGYQNSTAVDIFDTAQWISTGSITLGQDPNQSSNFTFTTNNIVVGPNNNYVIVEAQSAYGTDPILFAFQDGNRLPNSATLAIGNGNFTKKYLFDTASNQLFFRTNNAYVISYVQVDSTGLSSLTGLASVGGTGSGNGFDILQGKLYSADGAITDIATKNNVGYIPCNQSPCVNPFEDIMVDPYLQQILYVSPTLGVQTYDLNSKEAISSKSIFGSSRLSNLNRNQVVHQSGSALNIIGKGTTCWINPFSCTIN